MNVAYSTKLSDALFEKYRNFIYDKMGVYFSPDKKYLIQAKLNKLVLRFEKTSYDELYDDLRRSQVGDLWDQFKDEITTHKTNFFREIHHFNFIQKKIDWIFSMNPRILRNGEMRLWSAGCSTGEEPYTLSMILNESLPPTVAPKILGTDISKDVLSKAIKGLFPTQVRSDIDGFYLMKYFERVGEQYRIKNEARKGVSFRLFNLMESFPFKKGFDIIFCRNVMIYFDAKTQESLFEKFFQALHVGGLLFVGHSESLINRKHRFQYIQPTVYIKK